jgi:ribosomal protein S18 acetylase RimI-like enzyme
MPAEVIPRPEDDTVVDPSKYAVAAAPDRYLGLIRVVTVNRPRIGLVAVRAGEQRRGIARALLAHALGTQHRSGFAAAYAEVHESNQAASALFEGIGARPMSSNLELVR